MMAYAASSWAPSSQSERPSREINDTMAVENPTAAISNPVKKKLRGLPATSEKKTRNGATKRAICVLDPTAISIATSI